MCTMNHIGQFVNSTVHCGKMIHRATVWTADCLRK